MPDTPKPEWIAAEFGETWLRLWAMREGAFVAEKQAEVGRALRTPDQTEAILLEQSAAWLGSGTSTVIACGEVKTQAGVDDTTYRMIPIKSLDLAPVSVPIQDMRIDLFVIPGLRQTTPPDIAHGDETRIAGFLALDPRWDGVICLPGQHSRWAHVSAGEVVSMQSFLTGNLLAALGQHTALQHSLAGDGWSDADFAEALEDAMARPERLAARLHSLYAHSLLNKVPSATTRARLSGLLIGAELAAARPYWLGQNIAILDCGPHSGRYAAALERQGVPVTIADATRMTLAGLTEAFRALNGQSRSPP